MYSSCCLCTAINVINNDAPLIRQGLQIISTHSRITAYHSWLHYAPHIRDCSDPGIRADDSVILASSRVRHCYNHARLVIKAVHHYKIMHGLPTNETCWITKSWICIDKLYRIGE